MDIRDGATLSADTGVAIRIGGHVDFNEPGRETEWVTITIAGGAIRWTRSDDVPWSAQELDALSDAYWDDFAERGERLKRSLAHAHLQPQAPSTMAHMTVDQLRDHLARLHALPETVAASGIDEAVLVTLAPELLYVREHPRWREHRDEVLAELARRGAGGDRE
jgi:hypothetical protein